MAIDKFLSNAVEWALDAFHALRSYAQMAADSERTGAVYTRLPDSDPRSLLGRRVYERTSLDEPNDRMLYVF